MVITLTHFICDEKHILCKNIIMKTVLITGATSGIGLELAKLFAKDGYHLILIGRNTQLLEQTQKDLQHFGIPVMTIEKDLSVSSAAEEIFHDLQKKEIAVDVLVNNAGFGTSGEFYETDLQTEIDMIQVNIASLTALTKFFLPAMLKKKSGKILNIASVAAFFPGPHMAVYYATKAYVLSFSEAIAEECRGTGVTVTALCPGPTESNFAKRAHVENSPLFRSMMSAEKVAAIGYDAMQKGKRVVFTSLGNAFLVEAAKFVPRSFVTKTIARYKHAE